MKRTFPGLSCILLCGVLVAVLAHPARAQQQPTPEEQEMETLRAGIPSERDNPIVDRWVESELNRLRKLVENPLLVREGVTQFIDRFRKQYNHADNTQEFKSKVAERTGKVFGDLFKKQGTNEVVTRAAATVVLTLQDVNTDQAYIVGLSSTNQAVRYLACAAIIELHDEIAKDAQLAGRVLQAIAQAGANESNWVALSRLYQAAGIPGQEAAAVPVVLQMMDARLQKFRAAARDLDRAEISAVEFFDRAESAGKLDAALRADIVQRLAPLLRIHTMRYGERDASEEERAAIAATIVNIEDLLKRIVKPAKAPDVAGAMQKGEGTDVALNMEIELLLWIGAEQKPGVLNDAPWNVPVGAP